MASRYPPLVCSFLESRAIVDGALLVSRSWFEAARSVIVARCWTTSSPPTGASRWRLWTLAVQGEERSRSTATLTRRRASIRVDGKGGLSSVGVEGQILRDVHRTFSKFALFMDPDGAGQALLANVLKRLAHVDEIDYCQGMNFVVGVLLMVVTGCTELEAELDSTLVREVEAFRARHGDDAVFEQMIALLDAPRYRLRGMWSAGFPGLVLRSYQFTQICNAILPKLCAHMVVMDLSTTAFISQWFLTLFAYTLPTPLLLRIWDLFFISGWSAIIAVSVAILETNEAHLLACTFEEFLQFVGRNSLQVHYEDAARCERLLEAAAAIHRTCWASMAELEVKYRRDRLRAHVPSACDLPSTPIRTHIRKLSSTSTGALSSSIDSKHRALNNMLRSAKQQLGGGGGTSTVVRPKHIIVDGCTVKHIIVPPSPKHKPSSLGAEAEGGAVASDVASNAKGKGFGDLPDLSALSQREVQLSREWAALNAGLRYDVTVLQLKIEGAGTQIEELTRMLDAEIIELKKVEEAAQSCMTNKEQLVEVLQHLMFAGADASRHFDREKQVHLREEITKVQRRLSDVEIKWSDVKPKWRDECFFKEELQTRLEEQVGLKTALCAQLAELMERHRRAESRALQDIFGGDGESVSPLSSLLTPPATPHRNSLSSRPRNRRHSR